jgi:hypothetical protein
MLMRAGGGPSLDPKSRPEKLQQELMLAKARREGRLSLMELKQLWLMRR